jgi:hypothetical protein
MRLVARGSMMGPCYGLTLREVQGDWWVFLDEPE